MLVEKVASLPAFLALEREWRVLETNSGQPFASWDWALAWWTELRATKLGLKDSLFVRAIRTDDGRLVAVAPMIVSRRPSFGPLCVRQLQFFGADENITELRGLIALPEWRDRAYRALLAHIRQSADEWDWMLLSGVPRGLELAELSAFRRVEWVREIPSYEVSLAASWAEFRGGLPRNIKESLRKCYNSLKRDGREFRVEIARSPAEVGPALERFYGLHSARARLSGTVVHRDVFEGPPAQRFLGDVCRRFAERDCLRIFQLIVDDKLAAVRIGFVIGDVLYLYYSGYDAEYAKYSVMTTAVAEAIKYAISAGMSKVHLSTGSDVSKLRWNPVEIVVREATLVSPSTRGRVAHRIYAGARSAIGNVSALHWAAKFLSRRSEVSADMFVKHPDPVREPAAPTPEDAFSPGRALHLRANSEPPAPTHAGRGLRFWMRRARHRSTSANVL